MSLSPADHWALWRADPHATPFQSPAWIDAWATHLLAGPRVDVVARVEDRPVAALPCFRWLADGRRRLAPLAAGNSDYCDALCDPAVPDAAARLWRAFAAVPDWNELWLPDLRAGSPLLGPLPPGWTAEDTRHETCPVLAIPSDGRVLAALSKSQRRKIVHDRHRADALGGVATELVTGAAVAPALDALFALHTARWAAANEAGVLADPRTQAFLHAAATALDAAGLLRLAVVRHAGEAVAVLLALADARAGYSYINGVRFTPGQSFGTLAFAAVIEQAGQAGAAAFHFLRGEEPYKYGWGATPTHTTRRIVRRG